MLKTRKRRFDFSDVEAIMQNYLKQWGIEQKPGFAELYFKKIVELAMSKAVRIPLPHNLGYIQVLEHAYNAPYSGSPRYLQPLFIKKEIEHIMKFGYRDYSLVWKHSLFLAHHAIKASKQINEAVKNRKLEKKISYLKDTLYD